MAALRPTRWRLVLIVLIGGVAVAIAGAGGLIVTGTWTPDVDLAGLDEVLDRPAPDEDDEGIVAELAGPAYYDSVEAACGLLDPEDLELALAHPYQEGIAAPIDHGALADIPALTRCWYPAADPARGDADDAQPEQPSSQPSPSLADSEVAEPDSPPTEPTVASDVVIGVAYAYAEQIFADAVEARRQRSEIVDVEGLGDQAVYEPLTNELLVLEGERMLGMLVTPAGDEPDESLRERTRRLAERALERLR